MAMIENIYETMNLRITETAFELHLRKIYPTRNILSMRETETISGQECLDVQKKTDGSVNIIGEVATDPVASWMIQSAQVASKFTLFTHHAKTFPNLVTALRNSMLRAGTFKDEKTAEEQVVQVLNFDIHLVKDFRGRRYIERITECIPVEEKNEYTFDHRKEKTLEGKLTKFMDNATIFFSKTTNRELYKYHNILEFADDSYVLVNPITETNIREMRINMEESDVVEFDAFLERNWGIKPPKMPAAEDNNPEVTLSNPVEKKNEKIDTKIDIPKVEDIKEDEFKIDGLDEIGGIDDQFDQLDELYPKVTLIDDDGNDIFSDKQENNQNTDKKNTEQKKPKRNIGIKRPSIPTKEKPKTDNNKTSNNDSGTTGSNPKPNKPRSSILGPFADDDDN